MESLTVKSNGKLPRFVFKMELPVKPSKELRIGSLSFFGITHAKEQWTATSGYPPHQYSGSTNLKGRGPIPGCTFAQVPYYEVLTRGNYQPNTKGIEGTFYPILPLSVRLKGTSIERSQFGIHFDANVAGSAGCIVLRHQSGWDSFRKLMRELEKEGVIKIPLIVEYT